MHQTMSCLCEFPVKKPKGMSEIWSVSRGAKLTCVPIETDGHMGDGGTKSAV